MLASMSLIVLSSFAKKDSIVLISSCSNNGKSRRTNSDFLAYYNTFYTAETSFNEALEIIKEDNSKYITTVEGAVFNNYLTTKKIFVDENIILLDENAVFPEHIKSFWFICLNNARFAVGEKSNLEDIEHQCKNFKTNNDNFKKTKEIKINDFILKKFEN